MGSFGWFPAYVSVAEKKERAKKSIENLKKKNPNIEPIIIEGRKIVNTWWGKAWSINLESYSDYANRIGRGRSYVRHSAVLDLKIKAGSIKALVQGSEKKPYSIEIEIKPLDKVTWETIVKGCEGKLDSLEELLTGKFPKALENLFTAKGNGLFPAPKEIGLKCNCPDSAVMCKHIAAVLYGVGARLDSNPALFFELRNVKVEELISETTINKSKSLIEKSKKKSGRVMEDTDISDLFGIELESEEPIIRKKPGKKTDTVVTKSGKKTDKVTKSEKKLGKMGTEKTETVKKLRKHEPEKTVVKRKNSK